ncbi:MAG: 3-hydroxyacyl-CoA dehydrogenase NAD-binding domain-containing protein [bacterium]|nr:3-hydroxyacyl-CoA dehydrogenase NAD-binding domain-containing protein [bacterium]
MTDKINTWDDVEILVIGAGTMGASIAQAYAQNGFTVGIIDIADNILEKARATIQKELDSARGRIFSDQEIVAIQNRILMTTDYPTACGGKNLKIAIESATERLDIKKKIFKELDKLCAPDVVLATNSSSLNVNLLADAVKRSDKVAWMHYFYLPHKNRGGEVAGTDSASEESIQKAMYYMKMGGKIATPINSSRKGGAADILFVALLLEACRMVEEGFDKGDIEAAGGAAFKLPMGFLGLMDATGIAIGLYAMDSFADKSDPSDLLLMVYQDFFKATDGFRELCKKQKDSADPSSVRWLPVEGVGKGTGDAATVTKLKERFLAVAFMAAFEIVNAGVVTPEDFEDLAKNAFLWRQGPFAFFNQYGIKEAWRMVQDRAKLAEKNGHHFPIPENLKKLAKAGKDLVLDDNPIDYYTCSNAKLAWITLNSPTTANALDDIVFDRLEEAFGNANADKNVESIVFDTASIKTFIAGANVPKFVENMEKGDFKAIRVGTERWQQVLFHKMTGSGKPKVAIVDGQAFGGGVETAMAFAWDPDSIVIATNRTSYTLPETRLGIFPGLRGTLMLSRIIHRTTGDAELALAMARYYILAAGTPTTSPRLLRYFGLADLVVPSNKRDEVAVKLCKAIADNGGKQLTREQIDALKIEEIPLELTYEEKMELHYMKILFLSQDLIPMLYAYGRRLTTVFHTQPWREQVIRVANRVAANSPNAVWVSNWLISKGFDDYMKGVDLDVSASYELNQHLEEIFKHPDAMVGLKAMLSRKFPVFPRRYPFGE